MKLSNYIAANLLLNRSESNFSIAGAEALAKYFEELEEEIGEELEFDPVAIAIEYSELRIEEALDSYQVLKEEYKKGEDVIEILEEYTTVIKIDEDKIIIKDF